MADFYVLPAYLIENAAPVAAVGERNAAKKAAERDGITAGRVAVIAVNQVLFKEIGSTTSIDAADV